jgi:hypothetical protein
MNVWRRAVAVTNDLFGNCVRAVGVLGGDDEPHGIAHDGMRFTLGVWNVMSEFGGGCCGGQGVAL